MIIRTLGGANREIRGASWPDNTIPPRPPIGPAASGESVSPARAAGLPAFGAAVRKIAGVIAAAKLDVYSGEGAKKRERPDSWQAKLFDQPSLEMSRFDWLWDIASSLEVFENAVLQKVKNGSRVVELRPIPMDYVAIYRDKTGAKIIEVLDGTRWQKFGPSEVLHIRGQTIGSGVAGVSKVTQHRDPIGSMLAAQRFEGNYFRNHARPDLAFIFPETVSREQADEWRPYIDSIYGGAQNFGKPIPIGGGVQIQPIPINMRDAQFIEARQLSVEDVARIMDVHSLLLDHAGQRLQGDALRAAMDIFMHLQMPPRLKRITDAFLADLDLFGGRVLYPEICIDELSFLDPLTRAQVEHQRVQDGTQLVDEVRASHGWAPLPPIPSNPEQTPGMVPQLTPVGGQANPNMPAADEGDPQENMLIADLERRLAETQAELRAVRAQPAPQPHVTVHNHPGEPPVVENHLHEREQPAPVVENHLHERELPVPVVNNEITVEERKMEMPAPVVNITNQVETPTVTVENNITVEDEPIDAEITFNRKNGLIASAQVTEADGA